jgi:hypothetical protein
MHCWFLLFVMQPQTNLFRLGAVKLTATIRDLIFIAVNKDPALATFKPHQDYGSKASAAHRP